MDDAFGKKEAHLCSADLREFIKEYSLDLNQDGKFNPRDIFGSHTDADRIYNTPRGWYMGRCLTPFSHKWDGPDAEYTPESDNIPWCLKPDRKIAVEDVKYILSTNYQGTPFNPYSAQGGEKRGMYRSIGINRTGVTAICQIRPGYPEEIKAVEWVSFGPTTFNACLPVYPGVAKMPKYLSDVALEASTENFCWGSWMIAALADHEYASCVQHIERYQDAVMTNGRRIILEYDKKMKETGDYSLKDKANEELCAMAKEQTLKALTNVLHESCVKMKNGFNRADN